MDGILGLQPRDKVTVLAVNTIKFFSNKSHENRFLFPVRNAFVLDHQHDRPGVICEPAGLTEIVHFVRAQRFLRPSEKGQRKSLMLSWIETQTNQKVKSDILTQVICDVTAGAWGKKFNAVSHKPKLTGTD